MASRDISPGESGHGPPDPPRRSWAARAGGTLPFAVVAAVYILVRVVDFVGIAPGKEQDTFSYLEVARLNPFSGGFLAGPRGWVVPLFYKILGDDTVRIYGQLVISIACWLLLAFACARVVRSHRLALAGFVAILLLSLAAQIVEWDSILLSESLGLSLGAALVAGWLLLVRLPRWPSAVAVALLSLLWAFTRDTNAYLVLLSALPPLAFAARAAGRRRLPLALACGLVAVFVLATISTNGGAKASDRAAALAGPAQGATSFGREPEAYRLPAQQYQLFGDGRWEFPLLNVIGSRVLPDRARLEYFQRRGMPVDRELLALSGGMAAAHGGAFYRSPGLRAFRQWLKAKGQTTYIGYLLSHPVYTLRPLWSREAFKPLLFPSSTFVKAGFPLDPNHPLHVIGALLPSPAQNAVLSSSSISAALWLLVLAAAVILLFRRFPTRVWAVPVTLLVITVPHYLLVWHGDAQDPERHGLSVAVLFRVGLLLMILVALDSVRRHPTGRPLASLARRRKRADD
jgi:hypothetical protein